MKPEDEVIQLQAEKQALQEQLAQQDELIAALLNRVQVLEERLVKDSHNSHLPPSSDRFVRQPKSLRSKSGKKSGGQKGHRGQSLPLSTSVDEVIVKAVERCEHCGEDLREVPASQIERRQVIDLPEPRLPHRRRRLPIPIQRSNWPSNSWMITIVFSFIRKRCNCA